MRRGLAVGLLSLPLLAAFAAGAQAQVECTGDGPYTVPPGWPLKPSGLAAGTNFRLLFVTSTTRDATATDIATYNTYVQTRAKAGHSAITDSCGDLFKVVGSTSTVDARDNTGTTGTGVPIYWLTGAKVADDYADFYDNSWDSKEYRDESGNLAGTDFSVFTGSNANGTKHPFSLGAAFVRSGNPDVGQSPISAGSSLRSSNRRFYALSPVFVEPAYDNTRAPGDNPVNVWGETAICSMPGPTASPRNCTERIRYNQVDATEGGSAAEVTVGLSRRLQAGDGGVQTVTVPLTVSGTNITTSDYTIALDTTARPKFNTGVTLDTSVANRPVVTFTGHATNEVRFAMLLLRASADARTEGTETLKLRIGSVSSTNITRGTSLHANPNIRGATVRIADVSTGMGQTAPAAPTEAVTNVAVTAESATRASVRWDAVAHATSYRVSWKGTAADTGLPFSGATLGVTGTSTAIDHDALGGPLTVTVTPAWVNDKDETVHLDSLAGTAVLVAGVGSTQNAEAQGDGTAAAARAAAVGTCVSDGLKATTQRYYDLNSGKAPKYGRNWFRVMVAFGMRTPGQWPRGGDAAPYTAAEARTSQGVWHGWKPFAKALECIETELAASRPAEDEGEAQAQQATEPEVTVTAGTGVTEGTAAGFTLQADPAPAEELEVKVTVAQTGAVADAAALGTRSVTIPAGETEAAFTVATQADGTDEPSGAVTATVADGDGYTVGGTGPSATVAVADDDATTVALSAPAGDVREASGGTRTLTLTLGRALVEGERLAAPLVFAGTATLGTDYTLAAPDTAPRGVTYANLASTDPKTPPTVTFAGPAGGSSATEATLVLAAVADRADEGEKETVTVKPGTLAATGLGGGAAASGSASFAIVEPPPEVSIAAKAASVTEGTDAGFTLTASRAPGADLTVHLTVSEAEGSDVVAASSEGATTVVIAKGKTEAVFSVPTVDDTVEESDGTVRVTVDAGTGYTVAASPGDAAQVEVADDDAAAPAAPTFSVADETFDENTGRYGGMMYFTIRLDRAAAHTVTVTFTTRESTPVSARHGVDYSSVWRAGERLTYRAGQTEKRLWVYVYNDNHDEDPETFEAVLSHPTGGAVLAGGKAELVAIGTIVNDDPMPAAWLSRFGRTAAEAALDGIAGRMAAPRTAGVEGTLAGHALTFGSGSPDGSGAGAASGAAHSTTAFRPAGDTGREADTDGPGATQTLTLGEVLLGSHFTATSAQDAGGGSLGVWGRAAQSRFDGREGAFSLDGEATTAMLGADYARGDWLLGLTLMQTDGKGGYRDTEPASRAVSQRCADAGDAMDAQAREVLCSGAVREGDGKVEASLTAAIPYAALEASERLKLWGALGVGDGEVTLKPALGGSYRSDLAWTMAAAGARSALLAPPDADGGLALALVSDALWARTSSEKTTDLAASDSDVTRLRLGLEGRWRHPLDGGGHFTPKLEAGVRHDGGDAETGFGVELGGGLAWSAPTLGLSLDIEGRTLLAHGDGDLEDRGFAASFAFDPDPSTERGASFTLRQDWGGQTAGGLDALFGADPLEKRKGNETQSRWTAEAAYGLPAFGGRFTGTPHAGVGLSTGARDYTLGWRLAPAAGAHMPDLTLGVQATRRESDGVAPEHAVGFELGARW